MVWWILPTINSKVIKTWRKYIYDTRWEYGGLQSYVLYPKVITWTWYTVSTVLSITHSEARCYWMRRGIASSAFIIWWHCICSLTQRAILLLSPFRRHISIFFPFSEFFYRANLVLKPFLLPLITFHVALVVMQYTCLPFNTEIHFESPAIYKENGRLIHFNKAVWYFSSFVIELYLHKINLKPQAYFTTFFT